MDDFDTDFNFLDSVTFVPVECPLSITEQRVYLILSLEYQKILDDAPSYQVGAYRWNKILSSRLLRHGLTPENWERLSTIGDNDDKLQDALNKIIEKIFVYE